MPAHFTIDIKDLPKRIRLKEVSLGLAIRRGLRMGALRGKGLLIHRTPVDQGELKASWTVTRGGGGEAENPVSIENTAPHAGVVEYGARPHPVSAAGRRAIREWVGRHFPGNDEKELDRITWAICEKIRKKGQKPTYFIRNSLDDLERIVRDEVARALAGEEKKAG